MVTVTDSAREEFNRILETRVLESGKHLRLAVSPVWTGEGDFGIVIDDGQENDQIIDYQGRTVLLVGEDLTEQLQSSILDFKESPDGPRFTLDVF